MSGTSPAAQQAASTTPTRVVQGRPARYDRRRPTRPSVSVVIPTYNERDNLPVLLGRVAQVLVDFDYEIVVVDDDSPDLTWQVAEQEAEANGRVRVMRRVNQRGLSSAVLDGMAMASGRVLAVIDADLQHDEGVLADIVSVVLDDDADICLGSREAKGGSYGQFGKRRRAISWIGGRVARHLLGVSVSDPMSGYFAVSRERFDEVRGSVNPRGFKILLELLARGPTPRVAEIGYRFRTRTMGETKLTGSVALAYLLAVGDLAASRVRRSRLARYALVGALGLVLRLAVVANAASAGWPSWATVVVLEMAILTEFGLHQRLTFGDRQAGQPRTTGPLLRFHLITLHGMAALVGVILGLNHAADSTTTFRDLPGPITGGASAAFTAVVVVAALGTIAASYVLNAAVTWPRRASGWGEAPTHSGEAADHLLHE